MCKKTRNDELPISGHFSNTGHCLKNGAYLAVVQTLTLHGSALAYDVVKMSRSKSSIELFL